ncbi:hypothetical protein HK101_000149 [Irineochytrium annulatum]|nr:hypothetical protein HK101_000149 [Irineochytrium annulatum]
MKKVIVVGSGILGASTAYQLAKRGAEVIIIDRKDIGQATDAAAGIICPWLSQRRNQDWYQLAKAGARFYPGIIAELEEEGETETGYAQVGALSIHTDEDKINKMEERAQLRKADAPEIGEITPLDAKGTLHYQKAQIMHLHVTEEADTGRWPVIMPPSDQYLLAFDQQKIVIGATHENDVEGYDTRVTAGGMQEVLNKGLELAPGLTNSTFQEVRVGFRPFTPGFLPVMGAVPGWLGLITANGLGASGLTMGPFIGSQLAKLALGMELDIDIEPYNVGKAMDEMERANSSDIIYLEHQIGTTKEELRIAMEKQETYEREMSELKSSPIGNASKVGSDEQFLKEKASQTQNLIEILSAQLNQLEEALVKLGD